MMQFILKNSPLSLGATDANTVSTTLNILNIGTAQILTIPEKPCPTSGFI